MGGIDGGARGVGGSHGRVVLLPRDLVLGDEQFHALEIGLGQDVAGLGLAQASLGRVELGAGHVHFFLSGGQRSARGLDVGLGGGEPAGGGGGNDGDAGLSGLGGGLLDRHISLRALACFRRPETRPLPFAALTTCATGEVHAIPEFRRDEFAGVRVSPDHSPAPGAQFSGGLIEARQKGR